MATTMIRVRKDIHARLKKLSEAEGVSMQEVLARALEDYRRKVIFDQADAAYAALRANPTAWREELEERAALGVT